MKIVLAFLALVIMALFGILEITDAHTAQPAPGLDWYLQTVTQSGQIGSRGLRLDSAGHPHIAYVAQGALYHARHDGTAWQIETVDAALDSSWVSPSLALDHLDRPRIAYTGNQNVKYAYWASGIWNIQSVDSGEVGPASLALNAADQPQLVYAINNVEQPSGYAYAVKYAAWAGNAWHIQTVEQGINANSNYTVLGTSLALDSSGDPHISYALSYLPGSYRSCVKYCIKYAHWTGSAWNTQIVEQGDSSGTPMSVSVSDLVLDGADHPHLIFGRRVGGALYAIYMLYGTRTGNNWIVQTIDVGGLGGGSLALDTNGNPKITYATYDAGIKYAQWRGNTWTFESVDGFALATSLALDTQNGAHIAFSSYPVSTTLKYAQQLPRLILTKDAFPKNNVAINDIVTYTLAFAGPAGHNVQLLDPLPKNIVYVPESVTPPAIYSPTLQAILWQGILPTDSLPAISFRAALTSTGDLSPAAPVIINTAWLTDTEYSKSATAAVIVNGWYSYLPIVRK